jgi:hypothetical protein
LYWIISIKLLRAYYTERDASKEICPASATHTYTIAGIFPSMSCMVSSIPVETRRLPRLPEITTVHELRYVTEFNIRWRAAVFAKRKVDVGKKNDYILCGPL